jgi:hypothetical protein
VALYVFAYQRGGAEAVGVAALVTMIRAAVAAPFTALIADRMRRERVLTGALLVGGFSWPLRRPVSSAARRSLSSSTTLVSLASVSGRIVLSCPNRATADS